MGSRQAHTRCASGIYRHQPLDIENHQIRLLKLRHPSEHARTYCLDTFHYKKAPPYIALSYTWGDKRPTGTISIDGKKFEIRINLLNFLSTHKADEYLWIDQICIDQSNDEERSHQVKLMGDIYSRSDFVLVWLRDESTFIPSTQQAARDFNDGIESYLPRNSGENSSSNGNSVSRCPTLALLHNTYFDRLWIIQELLLSKNIRILVEGDVEVSWESLRTKWRELPPNMRETSPSTSWIVEAQPLRFVFAGHTSVGVTNYVTTTVGKFYDKKCENPKDKVYGLMALVQQSSKVEIDYEKSVQQVYLDAIMTMIKEYWYMRHVTLDDGYQLLRVQWFLGDCKDASFGLAKAMGFTDCEMSGLRSFVECIWERVDQHAVKSQMFGLEIESENNHIKSGGPSPKTHQSCRDEQLTATCDRWWYEFEGKRYYHDCEEWSGNAKLQEYTVSHKGLRKAAYFILNSE